MRLPALMMAVVMVAVFGAGCAKLRPKPRAPAPPKPPVTREDKPAKALEPEKDPDLEKLSREDKKRLEIKAQLVKDLEEIREKLEKLKNKISTKRAEGFDVGKADKAQKDLSDSLENAEKEYLLANISNDFSVTAGLIQGIKDSLDNKRVEKEIDNSPRFREKTKPAPGEFKDDRDLVISRLGHPDPRDIRYGPHGTFSFQIFDPTQYLNGAIQWGCYETRTSTFRLQTPPKIGIFEYHGNREGTYQFVFAEHNHCTQMFTMKDRLSAAERDQALSCLCINQGSGFENYKLIAAYKGKMAGMPDQILMQLLNSQFRFADQFGLGAMSELAKGGAAMPDLEVVSVVFSPKLVAFNGVQKSAADDLAKFLRENMPNVVEQVQPGLIRYDQEKSDNIKKAAAKVFSWQSTFLPQKNDKKTLSKLFGDDPTLIKLLNAFEEAVKNLAVEIKRIEKELLKFRRDFPGELGFASEEIPTMIFLLRGVGFETDPATERTLVKRDVPRIKIVIETYYQRNKDDPNPPLVRKDEVRISEVNKLVNITKEYQRLSSFMLGWPSAKTLKPGHYKLKFEITDEIREKAINYELGFIILPKIQE